MNQLLSSFTEVADEKKWSYTVKKDCVSLDIETENAQWTAFARAHEEENCFLFYSLLAAKVPQEKRSSFGELLHRLNFGLKFGAYEMDWDLGSVHFRTSVRVVDELSAQDQIKDCILLNVVAFHKYFPVLMKALFTEEPPRKLILEIEGA